MGDHSKPPHPVWVLVQFIAVLSTALISAGLLVLLSLRGLGLL